MGSLRRFPGASAVPTEWRASASRVPTTMG